MSPPTVPGSESEADEGVVSARERRRDPRATVPWPAIVQDADGGVVTGEVIDVSLSGMKLRVAAQVIVGGAVTIRVTLPRGAGEIDVSAQVIRRDPEGVGVEFGRLPGAQAERFKPFVPTWDLRRRAERVGVELPIRIEQHDGGTTGQTVDLSVVGGRVTTEAPLSPGSIVAVTLTPKDGNGPMRIPAVVWAVDVRGAVLVFANLSAPDFARLRSYVDSLLVPRP